MNVSRSIAWWCAPLVLACATQVPPAETARSARAAPAATHSEPTETAAENAEANPGRTKALADGLYRDAAAGRDDRFATDRQVGELRRAIALYQQFIERADGDPQFSEAVKRSRDRIQDAEDTIAFLLAQDSQLAR